MAAVDYFLKIDGITGESTDAKHKGEIEVMSWSWGMTQSSGTGRSPRGGKASLHDFRFVMRLNKASPALMKACATGQHIKSATLTARRAGKQGLDYLTFKFMDILVTSFETGAFETDAAPTDQMALNFSKIEIAYKPQKPDGTLGAGVKFGYDLKANKPL